jgi:hypothetical protein
MPDTLDFETINFTRYAPARKNVIRAVAASSCCYSLFGLIPLGSIAAGELGCS